MSIKYKNFFLQSCITYNHLQSCITPFSSRKGSSLKRQLDCSKALFLAWVDSLSWLLPLTASRTLISSLKNLVCTHRITLILASSSSLWVTGWFNLSFEDCAVQFFSGFPPLQFDTNLRQRTTILRRRFQLDTWLKRLMSEYLSSSTVWLGRTQGAQHEELCPRKIFAVGIL